jgi:hypothetical protein
LRQRRADAARQRQHGLPPEHAIGFLIVRIGFVAGMASSIGGTPKASAISRAAECFATMKSIPEVTATSPSSLARAPA